jgi:hypothetical protein
MATEMVPFGKYRGQPVAVLQQDAQYCQWLLGQGWVAERFPELHTIIINNFGEPSETPEHNALQARFLDDDFVLATVRAVAGTYGHAGDVSFEDHGIDAIIRSDVARPFGVELKPALGDEYPAVLRQIAKYCRDIDMALIIGAYTGVGATLGQVRKIFKSRNIPVFLVSEIEEFMKK